MNILIKPLEVKKDIKITKINKYFEQSKETKSALFYELNLIHIPTNFSASDSGYNEIEVMVNCLERLNKMVLTKGFFDNIPSDNIAVETEELNTIIK